MGRIQDTGRYSYDEGVTNDDFLVGSDADDSDITKSFRVSDLITFISTQISGTSADNIFQEVDLGTIDEGDSLSAIANALPAYTITETGLVLYTVSVNSTTADGLTRDLTYITLLKGKGTYGTGGTPLLDGDFYLINPVQLETVRNSLVVENLVGVDKILSGNVVYSGTGLVYESTPYTYIIGGVVYNASANNSITLSVGGAQPRKDVIIADTAGNITVIEGTEAASPAEPSLTNFDTQIKLTVVDVAALATTPTGVTEESMYYEFAGEPSEWTVTETTAGARISLNSALDPYAGSVSIRMANPITNDQVIFTNNVSVDMADHTHIVFRIKLGSVLPSGFGFKVTPKNAGIQSVGSAGIYNGSFGFDSTNITDYQLIAIPFSTFSSSVSFDSITLTVLNSTGAQTIYIDNVRLLAGIDVVSSLNIPLNTSDLVNDGENGTNPFITALDLTDVALTILDEGNGDGYVLTDSVRANFGNIGLHAVDLTTHSLGASTTLGAGGDYSFLAGEEQTIVGGSQAWGAFSLGSGNVIGSGANDVTGAGALGILNTIIQGYGAMAFGSYHTINQNVNGFGLAGGMNVNLTDVGTSGIGIALTVNARAQHVVGSANIPWAGSATAADRPIFTVGNGTYTTPAGKWLPLVASDAFNVFADGTIDAPSYGTGTITGTATYILAVDASGNFIEESLGGAILGFDYTAGVVTLGEAGDAYQPTFDLNATGKIDFRGDGLGSTQLVNLDIYDSTSLNYMRISQDDVYASDGAISVPSVSGVFGVTGTTINDQIGTTYTLIPSDIVNSVTFTNASPVALTVPTSVADPNFPLGSTVTLINFGAGAVTIGGGGVTFVSKNGLVINQNESKTIKKTSTDEWTVIKEVVEDTLNSVTTNGNTTANALFTGKIWTSEIQNNDTGNLLISGNQGLNLRAYNPNDGFITLTNNGNISALTNGETVNGVHISRLYNDTLTNSNNIFLGLQIADTVNMSTKTTPTYIALKIAPALTAGGTIKSIVSSEGNAEFSNGNVLADGFEIPSGTSDDLLLGDGTSKKVYPTIVNDTTTTYNFVLADANNEVTLNNAGAVSAILPANGTIAIPVGSSIKVINKGAGIVTLSVTTDTINTNTGGLTMAQYAVRTLYKIAATEWIVGF